LIVESRPGHGSAFAVYLELADEAAPKQKSAAAKSAQEVSQ
jgi:hypothetical protein